MRNSLTAALAVLPLMGTDAPAETPEAPERTMPHQRECTVPLPEGFWDADGAEDFRRAEEWAWNAICLGQIADMRYAPDGSSDGKECSPAAIERTDEAVPGNRKLRPEFLELILGHEPWASVPRHPQVFLRCALVSGNINLDGHEIALAFTFHQSKIDGQFSLLGTMFKRTLNLAGSTVTGLLNADGIEVGGNLFLRDGAAFASIDLLSARVTKNVEFIGSTVTGSLNASSLKVGDNLHMNGSGFAEILLPNAEIAGNMAFDGSTVTGLLNADGIEVDGSVFLRHGAKFAGIRLLGARVATNVEFIGSTVTGLLNADNLKVGGSLFLRDNVEFAEIDLLGARIAGNAEFGGSTVTGLLNADRMRVEGNLFLRDGAEFEGIRLIGASVAKNMEFDGSTVTGLLNASGLEVGDNLYLRNDAVFEGVHLIGAKIGGDVQLFGSNFGSVFDLTGAAIGGELHLSSGHHNRSPGWQNDASLILRNAKAEVLQARRNDWNVSDGGGLLPTDLTGFTYNRLGGLDRTGGTGMGDESADWLVGWIEAQRDHGSSYDPQPYVQLARALEADGATKKADTIHYAKFEHKRYHDASMDAFKCARLTIYRLFLGYGVHPFRILYWFAGLVALGWLFTRWSRDPSIRGWMGLWYSLENAIPLMETREQFKHVDHGSPRLTHLFHAQKVLGFVLATVLVGALTLLGG